MYGMTTTTYYNTFTVPVASTEGASINAANQSFPEALETIVAMGQTMTIEPINASSCPALSRFGCVHGYQVRNDEGQRTHLVGIAPATEKVDPFPFIPKAL